MPTENRSEFSDIVLVADLETGPVERRLQANDAVRAALAGRLGLLSVDSLSARITLRRLPVSPLVRVEGRVTADVTQRCIVSLGPVADHMEVNFSEIFSPADYQPRDEMEEDEIVDSFDDGGIDIGELVAQHLSLSLNPYPRAEGVELPDEGSVQAGWPGDRKQRPLAELGEMLKKRH